MIRQTDPPVEPNEPTVIVDRWLTTDHENARHLQESADEGGISALRAEAEEYLQINASTDPTASSGGARMAHPTRRAFSC